MGGEDELEREAPCRPLDLAARDACLFESRDRIGERLTRRTPLVLVLAATAQAMVLLGEVDELEVDAEGAQDECLPLDVEFGDRGPERPSSRRPTGRTCRAREESYPLLELQDLLALLLDEYASEDVAEEADVAP